MSRIGLRLRPQEVTSFSRPLALLVAGALFLENLDGTVLQTAAPAIARDFGITPAGVSPAIVGYLLAVAVAIPVAGWAAERYGDRRVFLWSVAAFTVASVACALTPDLLWLTLFRVAQGIGGALMIPVGRIAVLRAVRPTDLLSAMAYLTWPSLIAPVIAPFLGGVITDALGWRWIFVLNVPIGVALAIGGAFLLPRREERIRTPLDRWGYLLTAGAVVCLTGGIELLQGGRPWEVAGLLGAAVALAVAAARGMGRRADPLFDLAVMRIPTFRAGNLSGSVYRAVITGAPFLFVLLFQAGFGWSAATAGAMVTAVFVGNVGIKPLTSPIIRLLGFRRTLVWSIVAGAAILLAFARVHEATPAPVIAALLVFSGMVRSIGFSAYNTVMFADVPRDLLSAANSLSATLQQVGTALGVAAAAAAVRLGTGVAGVDAVASGYRLAFVPFAALLLIPLAGALRLPASAGEHATARR
ncbi:multidrug efflux MFS transporter [Tsukamurella sputi]|uniref:Multidrug efflux MFS transporter n=1 Tax=Tsukamurella sputi TaxID=2591848 RepID=A0A5C5RVD5_9ACTN|nr:MFS transporter [Tsukamurella sputi]TWS26091.1 multidrug efflux MFS transporter [Tsukamurella sputi]